MFNKILYKAEMEQIKEDRENFEQFLKTTFYEYLLDKNICFKRGKRSLMVYDTFRKVIENNEPYVGYVSSSDEDPFEKIFINGELCILPNEHTAIGYGALSVITSGSNSIAIGHGTLPNITTGANSIAIGHGTSPNITTGANSIALGPTVTEHNYILQQNGLYQNSSNTSNTVMGYKSLYASHWTFDHKKYHDLIGTIDVELSYETFFLFCYYLNFHDEITLHKMRQYFHRFVTNKINGYSPIGVTIMSKGDMLLKKLLIKQLLEHKYELSQKDLSLHRYHLYENIYNEQTDKALLLDKANCLDPDIKSYILLLFIECCKMDITLF
jgi:hypothetical protein